MTKLQEMIPCFALELASCIEWREYDRLLPVWYVLMVQYGVPFPDASMMIRNGDVSISQKRTTEQGEKILREFVCDNPNFLVGCRVVNQKFEVMDNVFSLILSFRMAESLRTDGILTVDQTLTVPEYVRRMLPLGGGCPQLLHTDL